MAPVTDVDGAANNMDQAAIAVEPAHGDEHGLQGRLPNGDAAPTVNGPVRKAPSRKGLKRSMVSLGSIIPGLSDVNTVGFTGGAPICNPIPVNPRASNRMRAWAPIYAGYTSIFSGCTPVYRSSNATREDDDLEERWRQDLGKTAKGKPWAPCKPLRRARFEGKRQKCREKNCKCWNCQCLNCKCLWWKGKR